MMNVGEPATWADISTVLKELDHNGDGVIDIAEFTKMILHDQMAAMEQLDAKSPQRRRRRFRAPRRRRSVVDPANSSDPTSSMPPSDSV